MSAGTAVQVRDLTGDNEDQLIDVSDMPSGELTVQYILDRAGVNASKSAVLVDGKKVADTRFGIDPGSQIIVIPNVNNG